MPLCMSARSARAATPAARRASWEADTAPVARSASTHSRNCTAVALSRDPGHRHKAVGGPTEHTLMYIYYFDTHAEPVTSWLGRLQNVCLKLSALTLCWTGLMWDCVMQVARAGFRPTFGKDADEGCNGLHVLQISSMLASSARQCCNQLPPLRDPIRERGKPQGCTATGWGRPSGFKACTLTPEKVSHSTAAETRPGRPGNLAREGSQAGPRGG